MFYIAEAITDYTPICTSNFTQPKPHYLFFSFSRSFNFCASFLTRIVLARTQHSTLLVCFHSFWLIFIVNLFLLFFIRLRRLNILRKKVQQEKREKNQSDDRMDKRKQLIIFAQRNLDVYSVSCILSSIYFCSPSIANLFLRLAVVAGIPSMTALFRIFWFCLPSFIRLALYVRSDV